MTALRSKGCGTKMPQPRACKSAPPSRRKPCFVFAETHWGRGKFIYSRCAAFRRSRAASQHSTFFYKTESPLSPVPGCPPPPPEPLRSRLPPRRRAPGCTQVFLFLREAVLLRNKTVTEEQSWAFTMSFTVLLTVG